MEPNIHKDVDPNQPMGKDDKNYNDPSQVFPSETGSESVPYQNEAQNKVT